MTEYKVEYKNSVFSRFHYPEIFDSLSDVEKYLQSLKENWEPIETKQKRNSTIKIFEAIPSLDNKVREELKRGLILHKCMLYLKITPSI